MVERPGDAVEVGNQPHLTNTRHMALLAMAWERFWPLVLTFVCVIAVFLAVSLLGLWPLVNDTVRLASLAAFLLAALASLWPLRSMRWPKRSEVDSRIERESRLDHRPVTAQDDSASQVTEPDDPFSAALWREHKRRMAEKMSRLSAGVPVPQVAKRDPYALRSLVGLFLFIGLIAGAGRYTDRIGEAFQSHAASKVVTARIDAWVTPPPYTNRPPIFLTLADAEQNKVISVPEGSELVIRVLDVDNPSVSLSNGDKRIAVQPDDGALEKTNTSTSKKQPVGITFKTQLTNSTSARLDSGLIEGEPISDSPLRQWSFDVLADNDPKISFDEDPEGSNRAALEFAFKIEDDYGITSAQAFITDPKSAETEKRPLVEAPLVDLPLPGRRAREGSSKVSRDLSAHPWAGASVEMVLMAKDDAEQEGRSDVKTFTLPQRVFVKPLALALVDERRNLALDANAAPQVAEMLDIITTTHPDVFIKNVTHYTALRVIYRTIDRAENDDQLREALDLMWETALAIEDGNLSLAERRLRDAQERLSDALENGASDEEVAELMKELRAAMDEFMRELAEQMAKNPQNQQAMPMDPNTQVLRQQDLERMMKQIEDLAKSGSRDAARQMLEELQRMMNNLQTAQPNQNQQQRTDEFSQQMNKLSEMMRQQQQLMDETFRMQRQQQQQQNQQGQQQQGEQQQGDQQGQNGEQKPMTPEEFAEAMKKLQDQQGQLQKQMQEMQQAMRDMGLEPGKGLGEAGEAMGEAEGKLGDGSPGPATGDQGRALQAMREGAQQMMQNMQNQAGEQGRRGERGQHGQQTREDRDPLGRQSRSQGPQLGDDTKVPNEIEAQRAREILEAIRKRLGENSRPALELEYLDRLLPSR